jgi:hypothetical protein
MESMADHSPLLRDRSILVLTGLDSTAQALATVLTEHGADVLILSTDFKNAQRLVANLNGVRETQPQLGRAFTADLTEDLRRSPRQLLSLAIERLGGLDGIVEARPAQIWLGPIRPQDPPPAGDLAEVDALARAAITTFEARKRGRLVMIDYQAQARSWVPERPQDGRSFAAWVQDLQGPVTGKNIAINGIGLGATEELLQRRTRSQKTLKAAFDELQAIDGGVRPPDAPAVAACTAFLLSSLSLGLVGQVLRLGHSGQSLEASPTSQLPGDHRQPSPLFV